jgi:hypothetical protein
LSKQVTELEETNEVLETFITIPKAFFPIAELLNKYTTSYKIDVYPQRNVAIIETMDVSHTAYFMVKMPTSFLKPYDIPDNKASFIAYASSLYKTLRTTKKQVRLSCNPQADLYVIIDSDDEIRKLIHTDPADYELDISRKSLRHFSASMIIGRALFFNTIKEIANFSHYVTISIKNDGITFLSKNNVSDYLKQVMYNKTNMSKDRKDVICKATNISSEATSIYSIPPITDIAKVARSNRIVVRMGSQTPLWIFIPKTKETPYTIRYLLAPYID